MSREIKFRAWSADNGYMVHDAMQLSETTITKRADNHYKSEKMIWMQYTGLKDINGVEIYEGDIVRTTGRKYIEKPERKFIDVEHVSIIEWFQSFSNIGYRLKNSKGKTMMIKPSSLKKMKAEIIGNIHENPDLIKKPPQ